MSEKDRFSWFEYQGRDFPFYNGVPVNISGLQWLLVMAMTAIGFSMLLLPVPFFATRFGGFIPVTLFFAIPLAGLAMVASGHWKSIFHKVTVRDIKWMILIAILNMVVTMIIGYFVTTYYGAASNPSITGLTSMANIDRFFFFLQTAPQLFGEEVVTILPFLGLVYFFTAKLNWARKPAVLLTWLLTSLLFGAIHLPTYEWNFVQCFVVIGSARLILSLAYIKTKNIWVSTGAHIINDWTFFGVTVLGATMAVSQ